MKLLDIMTSPWAIVPEKLQEIRAIYETHMKGDKIDLKALQAGRKEDPDAMRGYSISQGVAVLPLTDVLTKNRTFFSYLFGGTSMRDIAVAFDNAMEDPEVHSIVLAIDSPGGTVDGTEELAGKIKAARGKKPIVAYSDGMMASAAYWIGSAAGRIYISGETTVVGSIGVVATHVDVSEADRQYGEKWTDITAGRYKRIASMHKPLSEEGRAYIQDQVDHIYTVFVEAVAGQRGRSEGADGKIFIGKKALDVGLVDEIATLGELITKLKGEYEMTKEEARAKYPDYFKSEFDEGRLAGIEEGKAVGFEAGKAEGMQLGAEAERSRIKDVESSAILGSGHEALIETFKYDGKTTGDIARKAVIEAENKTRAIELEKIKKDAVTPVTHAVPPMPGGDVSATDNLPIEDKAKREWDKSPELRKEFSNNFDNYLAFERNVAEGRIKILGRKE